MAKPRNKLCPLVLAACTLRQISIEVVRGDALSLGCDGVVTGPEGMRKCLPTIFPTFFDTGPYEWEPPSALLFGKTKSWWGGVAGLPSFENAPPAASPLKHIAIVRTTKQWKLPQPAGMAERFSVAGNVRESLGHLVSVGCRRVVVTFFRNEHDEATDILTGIRTFADQNPGLSLEICLCDTNDPVAFINRLKLLYLQNVDLW